MASPSQVLQDPNFQGLPIEERRKVLTTVDPTFGGLAPDEQNKVLMGGPQRPIPGTERLGGVAPPPHPPSTAFIRPVSTDPIDVGMGSPNQWGPNSNPDVPMWARELGSGLVGAAAGVSPEVSGGVRPTVSRISQPVTAATKAIIENTPLFGKPVKAGIQAFQEALNPTPQTPEPFRPNPNIQRQLNRGASGGTGSTYRLNPPPMKSSGPSLPPPPVAEEVDPLLDQLAQGAGFKKGWKAVKNQADKDSIMASYNRIKGQEPMGFTTPQATTPQTAQTPALEPPPGDRQARLHQQGGKTYSQYAEAKNQEIAKYLQGQGITPEDWKAMAPISKEAHIQKANPKYSPSSDSPRGFGRTATQLYNDIGEALRELGK